MRYKEILFSTLLASVLILGTSLSYARTAHTSFNLSGHGMAPNTIVTTEITMVGYDGNSQKYTYTPSVQEDTSFSIPLMNKEQLRSIKGEIAYYIDLNEGEHEKKINQTLQFSWNRIGVGTFFSGIALPHSVIVVKSQSDPKFGGLYFEYDDGNEVPVNVSDPSLGNVSVGDYETPSWRHEMTSSGNSQFDVLIKNMDHIASSGLSESLPVFSQAHEVALSFNIETPISARLMKKRRERREAKKQLQERFKVKEQAEETIKEFMEKQSEEKGL